MNHPTQEEMVLNHLKAGKTISPLESLDLYGAMCLAEIIFGLRKKGYVIETKTGTSFGHGKKKRFAIYKLISLPAAEASLARQRSWF